MPERVLIMHRLAWASLALLVLVMVIDSFNSGAPWIIWLVRLVPLLMFIPGMLRDKLRSYIWLCFVSLLYFVMMVLRMFADPTKLLSILGMASVVVLFLSAMLYVRWRAQQLRALANEENPGA